MLFSPKNELKPLYEKTFNLKPNPLKLEYSFIDEDEKPEPVPRTKKSVVEKPVPAPITVIKQIDKSLKGYSKSFEVNIRYNKDPLKQLVDTRKGIELN